MKKFMNEKLSGGFASSAVFGVLIGYISLLIFTGLSALIITLAGLNESAAGIMAAATLALAGFFCGFAASKRLGSKALIVGLAAGLGFYLSVAVISAAVTKSGFSSLFLIRLVLTTATSALGAFLSAIKKTSGKYI